MKKLTNFLKRLWKDESAQGATEYILLLVVIVGFVMLFGKQVRPIIEGKIGELKDAIMSVGK